MEESTRIIEYKCPCCNAGLNFRGDSQQLTCEYCGNTFDLDSVRAFNESQSQTPAEEVSWEDSDHPQWEEEDQASLLGFQCPSCGGEILCEVTTVASFCPYCDNPTILPSRVSGGLRPDALLPFQTTKEDAKAAFLRLCKGKPLLPRGFTREQRLERITGVYVPFWLYDCDADFSGTYNATRVRVWSDSKYNYTKTSHYLLKREADARFTGIPMDGSSKMDDTFTESIEPFDYGKLVDFDTAYLSGYLADKYDVSWEMGETRIRQRVSAAMDDQIQSSTVGYQTVIPASRQLQVKHSKARYALMPVWLLNTNYRGKLYTFAMNGQSGKMTGSFPICPKRTAAWFAGIFAAVTVFAYLVQWLVL